MEKTCLHHMEKCLVPGIKKLSGTPPAFFILFVLFLLSFARQAQATQVSGTLTVDPAGTASATVFNDLRSVVTYLTSNSARADGGPANAAPFGVNGALVINIANGTYTEQIDIPAITGASAANTITFKGTSAINTIITCTTAVNASRHTIRLSSASWIIIRDMTIHGATNVAGWPVHIMGSANNCRIANCRIDLFPNTQSTTVTDLFAAVVLNNSTTSVGTTGTFNNIDIDSNYIQGGHYGIYAAGTNASSLMIRVRNNTCDSANRYGFYFTGVGELKCTDNIISNRYNSTSVTDGAGIYLSACSPTAGSGKYHEILRNKIMNAESYGLFLQNCVTLASPAKSLVINNVIAGGFRSSNPNGINLSGTSNGNSWNIYYNSVVVDNAATSSTAAAFFSAACCTPTDQADIRNNHFVVSNAYSSAIPFYSQNWTLSTWATQVNYNNYYKKGQTPSTSLINLAGTTYTVSNLTTAGGSPYNLNAVSKDPLFLSNYNLAPQTPCVDGLSLGSVTTDINNVTRTSTPDIGAYEYSASANDAGITAIVSPSVPFNSGTQNVILTLTNFGTTPLTSVTVGYQVNGGTAVTQSWSGNLAPCASTSVTFSGAQAVTLANGTLYSIKGFTANPVNGSTDGNVNNDTTTLSNVSTALSGTYTINQSTATGGSNYNNFTDAVNALISGGVNGPVLFNVVPGLYYEQVTIPAIPGASATNTVTFDGGAGLPIMSFANTAAAPHTLKVDNASYIIIKGLTIKGAGTTNAWPLHLLNANNITVQNCTITFTGNGLTSSSSNYIALVANGSTSSFNTSGSLSNLLIDNNTVAGGYAGIYISGITNTTSNTHTITNNTVTECSNYGIYENFVYYDLDIRNNNVTMRSPNTNGIGISVQAMQSVTAQVDITGNTVKDAAQYGMQLANMNGSATYNINVANNMVGGGFTATSGAGIYITSGSYVNAYFNTVHLDMPAPVSSSGALQLGSVTNCDIRNNNLAVTGSTNGLALPFIATNCTFIALDYNNYYRFNNANQLININGALYSQTNMTGAGGYNLNSSATDPEFTGPKDLHISLKCLTGTGIAGYNTDIDGNSRNNPPFIGADENTNAGVSNDLSVQTITAPMIPLATGSQDITALIRNNGTNTITSATIYYRVNGGTPVSQAWSGSLAPCDAVSFTFTSQYNFTSGSGYTVEVYSALPNGVADNRTGNDTAKFAVSAVGMSGNYTINPSGSGSTNYTSFLAATVALNTNGVSGPVVFTVSPATYNAQVSISGIPGASATNTITFDGGAGNASSVILTYNSTSSSSRHTLRIDNAQWIRIRNMSIIASGTQAWPVHIYNNASNLQISNCIISCTQTLTSQTSTSYAGIVFSNSTSTPSSNVTSYNVDIDSNTITNGWYGIYAYGNTTAGSCPNINIRNNKIDSSGLYGVYMYYITACKVTDNRISMRMSNGASTTSNAILLQTCLSTASDNLQVNRNKITGATQYGIYLSSSGAAISTMRAQMINNSIGGGFTNSASSGIYLTSSLYWDIYFNSVNIDHAATGTTQAIYLASGSATYCDIRNNNLAVTNTGASGAVAFRSVSGATVNTLNYNNYYKAGATAGTTIISVTGANYNPANFNTATAGGTNSINQNPSFTSSVNLLPTVNTNKGQVLASVPTDINGSYRNIPPDLGAYELPSSSTNDLAIVSLNSPDTSLPLGTHNVIVTVRNFGSAAITSFNLRHTLNGSNMQDTAITGINLAQGESMVIDMGSDKQVSFGMSANTLKVYLHLPNGGIDGNQLNDSFIVGPRYPALSGVFTINPAGSGSSNFTTFAAAVTALNNGGVNGPAVFNVASATFNEQITINTLPGSSALNTIRFVGSGTANTSLNFAGATYPNQHTVRLNGANWVSFENMTISGGGTTANWVVHFLNAANCTVKKCKITLGGSATGSTSNAFIAIVGSSSSSSGGETSTSATLNNIVIDSNLVEYGFYGAILSSSNGNNINYVRGNTFNNPYNNGVYMYFNQAFKITGNMINMRAGILGSSGIYTFASSTNTPLFSEIKNNIISNSGVYGIYIGSANGSSGGLFGEISNNIAGNGFNNSPGYALYMSSSSNWRVWHNTFSFDGVGNSAALNIQNGSNNDIRNNIFAIRNAAASLAVPVIINPATAVSVFNYNNLHHVSSGNLINIAGNIYTNTNYAASYPSGAGINSRNLNPNFASASNFHISEACMNGDNLGITTDIDGNARGTTPDMGAVELITVPALDASVLKINAPAFPFTAGSQPVNITIQNNGNTALTSLTLGYSVNGGAPVTQSWSGTLASCDTMNFTFASNYNFGPGPNVLKVYTASPNSGTDASSLNDTLTTAPFCVGLNGSYTINPTGAGPNNFTSFAELISVLNCSGLTGPVTVDVANGTYNEQVMLTNFSGISATNTLTIQSASGNAGDVTIVYAPGTENYVLFLNSADYVTLRNITLSNNNTSGSYFNVLYAANGANNNTFRSCVFTTGSNTSGNLAYSSGTTDNNNTFVNNTFTGGAAGILWQGNTSSVTSYHQNLVIDSNTFINQYNYGINTSYATGTRIRNNIITNTSPLTTYYGILTQTLYQNCQVTNNAVYVSNTSSTAYGIVLQSFNQGSTGARALVANNMIKTGSAGGTGSNYGLVLDQYAYYTDVLHNTVNIAASSGTSYAMNINPNFNGYTVDNCTFANNIFQNLSTSASSFAFYHNQSSAPNNQVINYNSYYAAAGNTARFQSASRATLNDWKTANPTYNVNSVSRKIDFAGVNDLHHSTSCLDNMGSNAYTSLVPVDIDGQSRSATPDIGADEYTAFAYDVKVSRISAPLAYNVSPQTVKAWIINAGSTTVTAVNLGYSVNGTIPVTQNITGLSLAPCDSAEVTFSSQLSTPTGYSVLKAFVSGNINTTNADQSGLNDTALVSFCTSLSGNFTINASANPSSTNFQSFTAAISAMKSCGLSGPAYFTIAPGTYNEQVIISNIPGVSATNTITFDGVDTSNRIVQYNQAGNTNRHVIMIDSCRYVTIRNLKIINSSASYGWGIHIRGVSATYNSDYVQVKNCAIVLPVIASSNFAGIVSSNSTTNTTTANNYAQYLAIDSNRISGGYAGVQISGPSTSIKSLGSSVSGNLITDAYYYGIYAQNQADLTINRNTILNIGRSTAINTYGYGIYMNYSDSVEVGKNKVFNMTGGNGISLQNGTATSTSPHIFSNNMIQLGEGNNTAQGIYLTSSPYARIYYNSIYTTTGAGNTSNCPLYAGSSNNLTVVNNNLVVQYNNNAYIMYYPGSSVLLSNYNNYYGGTYYNGYTVFTSFRNSLHTNSDQNSKTVSPDFVSTTDLHTPTNAALDSAGIPVAGITDDIDGQPRNGIKPDIGADEFDAPSENTGVIAITNPSNPVTPGLSDVYVVIRNFGGTVLTSDSVFYQIGPVIRGRLWTGSLASNATDTVKFTATSGPGSSDQRYNFPSGLSVVKAWTSYPNGVPDVTNADDTTSMNLCSGYGGTYTINPAGSGPNNFTSVAAAANALQCGVTAPVIFNIAPGTYNEQFLINPIPGASAVNTISFLPANGLASSVTIQYNATSPAANYVAKLAGADFVTFDKITFTSLSSSNGIVIDIASYNVSDKPGNITISNCSINSTVQTTSSNFALINCQSEAPNILITGNTFTKGSYAVFYTGNPFYPYTSGLQVTNNTIGTSNADAPYYYGLALLNTKDAIVTGNQIYSSSFTSYFGISLQGSTGKTKINNNKVICTHGSYGIYITSLNSNNETDTSEIINNAISVGGSSVSYGLYYFASGNSNIYYNSINNYSTSASSNAFRSYASGTNHRRNRLMNNVLVCASGYAIYLDGNNAANASACLQISDYNNYYATGAGVAFINVTGAIASLSAYKGQLYAGSDLNSVSGNPVFTTSANLVPTSCMPNAKGTNIPGITTDINGITRKTISPDMGAYEFTPTLIAPAATSPVNLCYGSTAAPLSASGTATLMWYTSATGGTGSTTAIIPNTGTRTTQTYYVADSSASSGCVSNRTAIIVNIDTAVTANTISSAQAICSGATPAALTGSSPTGGNGSFAYTWISSTTSATAGFAAASGTNNTQGYAPAALTATTWFKRVVASGTCGTDTSAAIQVSVDVAIANNSISGAQTICSGNTPVALTGSTPTGGNGSFTYAWISSTTNATTGYAAATGTNNTAGYAPVALTANTWYKRIVLSGACGADTSAAIQITVNTAVSSNTIGNAQTICNGMTPAALTGSTPTGGTGTYTYAWIRSTTSATTGYSAATGTNNTQGYAPAALTTDTWYKRIVSSGVCGADTSAALLITVNPAITNNVINSAQTICSGSTPAALTGTTPLGGSGTSTFTWISSTTSSTAGFAAASGTNNTSGYAPSSLTATTWYRRIATSGTCVDTSGVVQITVNTSGTWTGSASNAWNNTANWSCPQLPSSATNVTIPSGMPNMPVITDAQQANNITIQAGASLTLSGASAELGLYGDITNNGTFDATSGKLSFAGTSAQTLPAGSYRVLRVNNSNGVTTAGAVTLTDSLILSNGTLALGSSNLTLGSNATATAGNANAYVKTNGTGSLRVQGVGAPGKTGNITLPVGNATYNPVVLSNSGTADTYSVWVTDSVTDDYSGNTPVGSKLTANAVNRTWIINEDVAGGSNATVTLQWNAAEELSGFTRSSSYVSHYSGTAWNGNAASAASGSNPYTQTRSGITSFSPFGVGSNGALPVELIAFTGTKKQRDVVLNWSTANERNNKGFEVQRAVDGSNWAKVVFVNGAGNSAQVNRYTATDADPFGRTTNVLYYRLKQTDLNGMVSYSRTITVNNTTAIYSASVTPNPFSGSLQLDMMSPSGGKAIIAITDLSGKVITEQNYFCNEGPNRLSIDHLDALKAGMYFVTIIMNDEVITQKVIKQ
jgi:hypothetical protein